MRLFSGRIPEIGAYFLEVFQEIGAYFPEVFLVLGAHAKF
jgi:hypothetical protein